MPYPLEKTDVLLGNRVIDINESGTIFYFRDYSGHAQHEINNIVNLPPVHKMNNGLYFEFVAQANIQNLMNYYFVSDQNNIFGIVYHSNVQSFNGCNRIHLSGGIKAGEGFKIRGFESKWYLAPGSNCSHFTFQRT